MKGIIVFYVNFHPELNQDVGQTIDLMLKVNKELIEKVKEECDYQIMIVPTTKEACRVEKLDFDKPYPRFLPRTHADLAEYERRRAERETAKEKERQRLVDFMKEGE